MDEEWERGIVVEDKEASTHVVDAFLYLPGGQASSK